MDERLVRIVRDVEDARDAGTCRACLADLLTTALQAVIDDMGNDAAPAREAVMSIIGARSAVAH